MKEEELKKLIEKYYNGECTDDEEITLRDYFRQIEIPAGYETEKEIFGYYSQTGEIIEPSLGFEDRILSGIDSYEKNIRTLKIRKFIFPLISTAAALLILAGSYFFFSHKTEVRDTFTDPKLAYAETMKILLDVSSQLSRGNQALEPVGKLNKMTFKSFESINKSTTIIEKNIKNLDHIQKTLKIER
jgi:hypothetical protein